MLGALERHRERWIVYSLGNFVFNAQGSYSLPGAAPYSLVAKLAFASRRGQTLRLYPIFSDNEKTGYQPRFVDDAEFEAVLDLLQSHSPDGEGLTRQAARGRDETGLYLEQRLS
jgi:UDP-N-acetylmuramoyl-tripeptide--D-alanyl-D-alanine ligase/cyanophycin synthetase/poly-gamma-glutamate synthesis protein (capsule biosynthesis protein)